MMSVSGVHFNMITMTALVCVGMVVAAGTLYVVTVVFISFALRMTSAVQTMVSIAGLACRLYGGRWEQAVHKVMTANVTLLYITNLVWFMSLAILHALCTTAQYSNVNTSLSRLQCKFIVALN